MKTIRFLIICLFLIACGNDDGVKSASVIVTDDSPPVIDPLAPPPPDDGESPDPTVDSEPVEIALYTSERLKFFDGKNVWTWKEGPTCKAESAAYSSGNVLYFLDTYGAYESGKNLVTVPDLIAVDGADVWIIENIDPEDAYNKGALYKDYTQVYKNSTLIGNWYDRQYKADRLVIHNGDAFARTTLGAWKHLNGTKTGIQHVVNGGFVVYDFNLTLKTAKIDGIAVTWVLNNFAAASQWLESGAVWYSQNGYSWNGVAVVENGLVMADYRVKQNVVISAGSRFENGETVLYWIDCSTGWVIRHVPSTNQHTDHIRLYTGDGENATGVYYKPLLKPVIAADFLYFIFDAQIYRYSFATGLTALFTAGVSEVWGY